MLPQAAILWCTQSDLSSILVPLFIVLPQADNCATLGTALRPAKYSVDVLCLRGGTSMVIKIEGSSFFCFVVNNRFHETKL